MNKVTLDVAGLEDSLTAFKQAWTGQTQDDRARISFSSPELLWKVLTAKRWTVLRTMTGQGPMTAREVARRVDRDIKAVHGDVHALLSAGLLRRTPEGLFEFPFDAVHVDFLLKAA